MVALFPIYVLKVNAFPSIDDVSILDVYKFVLCKLLASNLVVDIFELAKMVVTIFDATIFD